MTGRDIETAKESFAEKCDEAIKSLYEARDELFETMGQVSPMFSNEYKNLVSMALKDIESWKETMCKNIDRMMSPCAKEEEE